MMRFSTSDMFSADMVVRILSDGSTSIACFNLSICPRWSTISPACICATPTFGASGGGTKPPEGNVTEGFFSAIFRINLIQTIAAQAV